MSTLTVSLDVSAVPAEPVGAGRYTLELAAALGRRPDVSLVLWARRGDAGRWATVAGPEAVVAAVAPGPRPLRLAWEQLSLPRRLASSAAAVHHGPHYTVPERARLPLVATVHDLTFFDHPEWHERSKVVVFRRAIAVAARRAAAVVCVSARTAERLAAHRPARGRVFVVPHGIDHRRFAPAEPEPGADGAALAALGVRPPYVAFVGTLEPRKAVPDLVAAFDRLAGRHRDLQLVLAGRPGWGVAEVERAVGAMRHPGRVRRTGYVDDAAVPALLRGAAVVAYPALEEGFGLPALEALACGARLVTSRGTVMADEAGPAAWLAEPGDVGSLADALQAALDAPGAEVADRRRAGLAAAAARTWEAAAAGHLAAYRFAAGGGDR